VLFGPYKIIEEINPVAFLLALPPGARLHDVFHAGLLKKYVGTPPDSPSSLPPVHHGAIIPVPKCVLRLRFENGVRQTLVQWDGLPPSFASWEDLEQFKERYPQFQLEDELLLKGGVMLCGATPIPGARGTRQSSRRLIVIVVS
jgi:hypothetical protein